MLAFLRSGSRAPRALSSTIAVARGRASAAAVTALADGSSTSAALRHCSSAATSSSSFLGQSDQGTGSSDGMSGGPGHLPASKFKPMVAELQKLQASPWSFAYRLTGMFSDEQW